MEIFMIYSRATVGGGAVVSSTAGGGGVSKSTASGGGSSQTSSSGGGTSTSTSSGGGSTQTTNQYGTGEHVEGTVGEQLDLGGGSHVHRIPVQLLNHTHRVTVPGHTHGFSTPNHSHSVQIPAHSHSFEIPNHTHTINIPAHSHEIEHGIYEYPTLPTAVQITVDGNALPITAISGERIDLLPYLKKDSSGNIERGRFAEIKIAPNSLARINANVSSRLFIQSREGVVL